MPGNWSKAIILPIYKKDDKIDYKVLAILLKHRVEEYTERELRDYRRGFRKGRSTKTKWRYEIQVL